MFMCSKYMNSSNRGTKSPLNVSSIEYAIGVPFSEGDEDTLSRIVLRAKQHNFSIIVVSLGDNQLPAWIANQSHVTTLVSPDRTDGFDFRERLSNMIPTHSYRGIAIHESLDERINFTETLDALNQSDENVIDIFTHAEAIDSEDDVLIGIPAYNEASAIGDAVRKARDFGTVVVVDDGSDDDTESRAAEAGATVVSHQVNQGYGAALKTLFEEAKSRNASHLAVVDGDGQHDPSDIPRLVRRQQETSAELVIGSRFGESGKTDIPLYRRFGLVAVNTLTNLSFGVLRSESWVKDTQSGFRVYDRRAIETLTEDGTIGGGMGASTDILHHMHRNDYKIEEVGTFISYDDEDRSTHHPLYHGLTLVSNILRTVERQRPLTILGIPGFLVSFLGVGFGYWTFVNFIQTQTFPVGLAITSTLFILTGFFACFTAIILHSLETHWRSHA